MLRGSCPRGGGSQTAVRGSNYGHVPLPSHSAHSNVVYFPPKPSVYTRVKPSRLQRLWIFESTAGGGERGWHFSFKRSGRVPWWRKVSSWKHKRESNTQRPPVPVSLLSGLRNSPARCHSGFRILSNSDRKADELKIPTTTTKKSLIKRSAGRNIWYFLIHLSETEHINQQWRASGGDVKPTTLMTFFHLAISESVKKECLSRLNVKLLS